MKRFITNVTVATVGLALFAIPAFAGRPSGHDSGRSSGHDSGRSGSSNSMHRDFNHSFRANEHFDYRKHGFKSIDWTHYRWSDFYRCYCYYCPRFGWCFYEPTYSCYLPVTYYSQVYPQSAPVAPSSPSVIQQTTVVNVQPSGVPDLPTPPLSAPVPAPTAVQKTNVAAGAP